MEEEREETHEPLIRRLIYETHALIVSSDGCFMVVWGDDDITMDFIEVNLSSLSSFSERDMEI